MSIHLEQTGALTDHRSPMILLDSESHYYFWLLNARSRLVEWQPRGFLVRPVCCLVWRRVAVWVLEHPSRSLSNVPQVHLGGVMIAFQSDLFRHAGREETIGTCYLRASQHTDQRNAAEENWSIVSFYSASTAHIYTFVPGVYLSVARDIYVVPAWKWGK